MCIKDFPDFMPLAERAKGVLSLCTLLHCLIKVDLSLGIIGDDSFPLHCIIIFLGPHPHRGLPHFHNFLFVLRVL